MQIKDKNGTFLDKQKLDGVPFFDIKNRYELVAVYYAIFSTAIVIMQIAKVLDETHLKNCGAEYVLFKVFGNPQEKFSLDEFHATGKKNELERLHTHAKRKYKILKGITEAAGKRFTEPQYLEFKPNETRERKTERFITALKDLGLGDVSTEEFIGTE